MEKKKRIADCPFCGAELTVHKMTVKKHEDWGTVENFHFVECEYCGARGPSLTGLEEALALWNMVSRGAEMYRVLAIVPGVSNDR